MGNLLASCQTCSISQCDACAEVFPRLNGAADNEGVRQDYEPQLDANARRDLGQDYQPTNMSEEELMRQAMQRSLMEAGITPSAEDAARLRSMVASPGSASSAASPLRGNDARSEEEMLATAIRASEQEDRKDLRDSQQREYEESLAIDRQREEEKRQREQEEEQRRKESEEAEEQKRREEEQAKTAAKAEEDALRARILARTEEARNKLGSEPPAEEQGRVVMRVRTPEGKALKRAFRSTDLVSQVYDFILAEGGEDLASQTFRLIATMPRVVYENKEATLDAAGLRGQCALLVEIIEDDE